MSTKRKVAVWDVDGPINYGQSQVDGDTYMPPFRTNKESKRGEDTFDFIVPNKPFLKLTLDILDSNNVISVIGSQRIQMQDEDPRFGKFVKTMYGGLDFIFGQNRPYLKEDVARKVGQKLAEENTETTKNMIIKAYQDEFQVEPEDLILIDDVDEYKAPAEEAGHTFVHAPKSQTIEPGSLEDNIYLYETLLRTIPAHDIYKAIQNSDVGNTVKNEFKKQLITYQLDNLKSVTSWQQKVLSDEKLYKPMPVEEKGKAELDSREESAKEVLNALQPLISHTKWDIGYFGGVKVVDPATGIENTIPKGMNEVIKEIRKAQLGDKTWSEASKEVEKLICASADKKDHGWLNKRGATTQVFYDKAKEMLVQLREQEAKEKQESKEDEKISLSK